MSDSVPYRDTADQWDALKDRAVVDRETVRNRMRHGWALEPALTTPKEWKRPVIARIRALVTGTPGITADALRAAMPDVAKPLIYRTVGRDVTAGRITTVKVAGGNPDGWAEVLGYVMVAEDARPTPKGRLAKEDQWQPALWIHPIRRRLLGLPVLERTDVAPLDYSDPRRAA